MHVLRVTPRAAISARTPHVDPAVLAPPGAKRPPQSNGLNWIRKHDQRFFCRCMYGHNWTHDDSSWHAACKVGF